MLETKLGNISATSRHRPQRAEAGNRSALSAKPGLGSVQGLSSVHPRKSQANAGRFSTVKLRAAFVPPQKVENPLPYFAVRQVLALDGVRPIQGAAYQKALKERLFNANALLMALWDQPGFRRAPYELVIFQPARDSHAQPRILERLPVPASSQRWERNGFRKIADVWHSVAEQTPPFSQERLIDALQQGFANVLDLPFVNPVKTLTESANKACNGLLQANPLTLTPDEADSLMAGATLFHYDHELPEYLNQLFALYRDVQGGLTQRADARVGFLRADTGKIHEYRDWPSRD